MHCIKSPAPTMPPSSCASSRSPSGTLAQTSGRSSGTLAAWIRMRPRRAVGHLRTSIILTPCANRVAQGCFRERAYMCVSSLFFASISSRLRVELWRHKVPVPARYGLRQTPPWDAIVERLPRPPTAGVRKPRPHARSVMAIRIEANAEPIPGYRLIERIGGGGFGEVWKAEAPGGLHKAIKIIHGDLRSIDADGCRHAEQELRALKRLQGIRHPYLLSLERYDVIEGRVLIVTELADCNLWDRFREMRAQQRPGIPRGELLRYMEEAA